MIGGPGGNRHKSQRRILISDGCHTGPIGNKYIFTEMQLVPFIKHRSGRILPHSYAAHLMDIQSRCLLIIIRYNIFTSGYIQDFRTLTLKNPLPSFHHSRHNLQM